jgi:hypothetical protein
MSNFTQDSPKLRRGAELGVGRLSLPRHCCSGEGGINSQTSLTLKLRRQGYDLCRPDPRRGRRGDINHLLIEVLLGASYPMLSLTVVGQASSALRVSNLPNHATR